MSITILTRKLNKPLTIAFSLIAVFMLVPVSSASAQTINNKNVIDLVNIERSEEDIGILVENKLLSSAAEEKAGDMVKNNYFAHTSPQGITPWSWIENAGYDRSFAFNICFCFFSPAIN